MSPEQLKIVNYLCAVRLKGWNNFTKTGKVSAVNWYDNGEKVGRLSNYEPTVDLNQAMELLEDYEDYVLSPSADGGYRCQILIDQGYGECLVNDYEAEADNMATAISLAVLYANEIMPEEVSHADQLLAKDVVADDGRIHTNCQRCSRPLRSTESKRRGFGPGCLKKEYEEPRLETLLVDMQGQNYLDELKERRNAS